jgi:general secretion pathway protein J
MKRHSRGFTLIEVMVAVMIAAILAVMAFTAMSQALDNRDKLRNRAARLTSLQATLRSLEQDFSQMQPRPVREPLGDGYQGALVSTAATVPDIIFTRGGWSNPAGQPRSTLQRVRYSLRDGVLYRDHWVVLDAQLQPDPLPKRLLDGVKDFQLRYMDDARNWQTSWPPLSAGSTANGTTTNERTLRARPIAVEVTLTLKDWGAIVRIIEVAG